MPFSRPSLAQIIARVKPDIQGALGGIAAFLRASFERGLANAVAGVSHQLHGHLDWIAAQLDPSKADLDQLVRIHAAPIGVTQKQAVAARIRLTATGTNGTVVAAGWVYKRADGPRYTVDANATVAGGTVTIDVTAEVAGELANCDGGTPIALNAPIAGLNDDAIVASTLRDGSDIESKESLLQRVLTKRRTPIRGGSNGDYAQWAREVPGVTRAWEYPRREGAGTVTLYGVNDDGAPTIALTPTKLTEISTYLDQPGRQPSTVDVFVYTPTLYPLNPAIRLKPNTLDTQAAVQSELADHLANIGHPGGMTVLFSELNEAASVAPGEVDHEFTTPTANVVIPFGSIPVLGTPTWSTLP